MTKNISSLLSKLKIKKTKKKIEKDLNLIPKLTSSNVGTVSKYKDNKFQKPKKSFVTKKEKNINQPIAQRTESTPNRVRVIPMGGVEEVGRNMIIIEVGNDIFISDVGFEFVSDASSPGIDYFLPNIEYLEARKSKIKGVLITHAHLNN